MVTRDLQFSEATFVELLRWIASHHPERNAYTFLLDGETQEVCLTYAELDLQARRVAALLQKHVEPGARALLLYPPGLEYIAAIFGCWYAGVVVVPAYPPRLNQNLARIEGIIQNADAHVALTTSAILSSLQQKFVQNPLLQELRWLVSEQESTGLAEQWSEYTPGLGIPALLQYTSGSTGTPKGVIITHNNLLQNALLAQKGMGFEGPISCVGWLPAYHDMGLMGMILEPLFLGGSSVLMAPTSFLQRPLRWLQAISRFRADMSGAPNFAFDLCASKATSDVLETLDLSSLTTLFTGSEPVNAGTLERFYQRFAACGLRREAFYPCYGMAEATLFLSGGSKYEPPIVRHFSRASLEQHRPRQVHAQEIKACALVSCGRPQASQRFRIVDPVSKRLCDPGQIGEIWVASPNVAAGYWDNEQESRETFAAFTRDSQEGPFLRTGDLGFFAEEELFITGRFKELIIIHGQNYYPQDIERCAERSHEAFKAHACAAFSLTVDGEEQVVLVMEVERQHRHRDPQELIAAIRQAVLEEYGLHVYAIALIKPGSILKTSSGKIQRRACGQALLEQKLQILSADLPQAMRELIEASTVGEKIASSTASQGSSEQAQSVSAVATAQEVDATSEHKQIVQQSTIAKRSEDKGMQFSLLYFSSDASTTAENKYTLLLEGAKFADEHDFTAVWMPERHFHPFGGLYPNPSVLASALAVTTRKIRLRAGSVVLPMHNPIRVAEEWSVVDNLSSGRVDLAFAIGWNPNDFVLAPTQYADRKRLMFSGLQTFQRLWRGEALPFPNGEGKEIATRIYPRPKQAELTPWITCTGNPERFREAGAMGANVLTALLFQSLEELATKIEVYRQARAEHGYEPDEGHVTLMLHTFIGEDLDEVRQQVRPAFMAYLQSSVDLWRHGMQQLDTLSSQEREQVLSYAFERYFQTHALFGTPQTASKMVERLSEIGVNEIACLIDFGVDDETVIDSLHFLNIVRKRAQKGSQGRKKHPGTSSDVVIRDELPKQATTTIVRAQNTTEARHVVLPSRQTSQIEPKNASDEKALEHDESQQSLAMRLRKLSSDEQLVFLEQYIQQQIAQVLKRPINEIAHITNIRSLGLDSLMVMSLANSFQRDLQMTVDIGPLYERTSFHSFALYLAEELQRADEGGAENISAILPLLPRQEPRRVFPASFSQQRLWFLHQLQPDATAYNVLILLSLKGDLVLEALEWSLQEIIRRHESFRTTLTMSEGQPIQVIHEQTSFQFVQVGLNQLPPQERERQLHQLAGQEGQLPFNLEQGPLLRVKLFWLQPQEYALLFSYHHVLLDGWSRSLFLHELRILYAAHLAGQPSPLAALPLQSADFALWQHTWLTRPLEQEQRGRDAESGQTLLTRQLAYWRSQLAGPLPLLELPTEGTRPQVQRFHGAHVPIQVPEAVMEALKALSQEQEVTLFMTLLASFQVLLARYSGQEEMVVGTLVAGRNRPEVEPLIGFFLNPLALRTDLSGDPAFRDLLKRVRAVCLGAYAHQDVPFEQVVEAVQAQRDLSRHPLFQVLFLLEDANWWLEADLPQVRLQQLPVESGVAIFDLTWSVTSQGLGEIEYNTDLFTPATIERMVDHWQTLLQCLVAAPHRRISELSALPPQQWERLVRHWNQTEAVGAGFISARGEPSLSAWFATRAREHPDRIALSYQDEQLSYGALEQRASRLALQLLEQGAGPERLVAVCAQRSLAQLIGILAVFKAGGAYLPLDPASPRHRLSQIVADAHPQVLLTTHALNERLSLASEGWLPVVWLEVGAGFISAGNDQTVTTPLVTWQEQTSDRQQLAYVIYTSGSTGRPKGVMISQEGMLNHLQAKIEDLGLQEEDCVVHNASASFDISVWQMWAALLQGGRVHLLSTEEAQVPRLLWRCLGEQRVTVLQLVPSVLRLVLAELGEAELRSALRVLLVTGEALPAELCQQWGQRQATVPLVNAYGPTECSDDVTHAWLQGSALAQVERVPIGRPLRNTQLYVLDQRMEPVPQGAAGELYVGGRGVGRGYLQAADLTGARFVPDPFTQEPGGRLYRTGDLVRYQEEGQLEYLGRLDEQVKLRGYRIELGEIEAVLRMRMEIREAVVLVREDVGAEKCLVAYVVEEVGQELAEGELRRYLREQLPDYMVPMYFVFLQALPLTSNGKIDRRVLPLPEVRQQAIEVQHMQAHTAMEEIIQNTYRDVLGIEQVGLDESFFELGGHSLLAMQVISRLRKLLSIELPLRSLFEAPSVAGLAQQIEQQMRQEQTALLPPLLPMAREQPLPLSFAQERLWFLQQLEPENTSYHMPAAVKLSGALSLVSFEQSLNQIVARHEILRTNFHELEGKPTQKIAASWAEINPAPTDFLPLIDLSGLPVDDMIYQSKPLFETLKRQFFTRRFDLSKEPVLRVALIRLTQQEHLLLFLVHHIAADGWSVQLFHQELTVLYQLALQPSSALRVPPLPIQYADYALWQRSWLRDQVLQEQLAYWRAQLLGAPALLPLPLDRPRPAAQTYAGATQTRLVPVDVLQDLYSFCRQESVTLFMLLLAAFQVLLMQYTGEEDIVIGTPVAHRTRLETENLIGFFVNTLALRTDLSGQPDFRQLLARVREVTLQAYSHQDLPFERLVEELQPERSLSYAPLFQVLFVLQNVPSIDVSLPELAWQPLEVEQPGTKFDLSLQVQESEQGLWTTIEYSTDLFDASTIERMLMHWQTLLMGILAHPDQPLYHLPLLSEQERNQLLVEWNATASDEPSAEECLHQLFEAQTARTPSAIAIVYESEQISYQALNQQANQLAHHLRDCGVGSETLVALLAERGIAFVVAVLAIFKAGGAYLPLDPHHPQARLRQMIERSRCQFVLRTPAFVDTLADVLATLPVTDCPLVITLNGPFANLNRESLPAIGAPANLAYVIYTSGSTGLPKGTMIEQRGMLNHLYAKIEALALSAGDTVAQTASQCFDISVWQFLAPLLVGGRVQVYPDEIAHDAQQLLYQVEVQQVSILETVPSLLQAMLDAQESIQDDQQPQLKALRWLIPTGEALPVELCCRWLQRYPHIPLINAYGPTECSDDVAHYVISQLPSAGQRSIPIGRAIRNIQLYVLDQYLQPVPIGVSGELYIGGIGVGRGYLGDEQRTREAFVPNPFSTAEGAQLYRTGDLVRYLSDGNLEFIGRRDTQVKLRGFRIELGEIEATLSMHPEIQDAIVLMREDMPGDKRLVAYVVVGAQGAAFAESEIRQYLCEILPDYMMPTSFVPLAAWPLTANGKVDRRSLPAPSQYLSDAAQSITTGRTPIEELMLDIYCNVLGREQIGIHENFFDLGGHSLLATQVIARIRSLTHAEIPLRWLFETPSVAGLAQQIARTLQRGPAEVVPPLVAVSHAHPLPLSFAQERLWFLQQLEPANIAYTMSSAFRFSGPLSIEVFERCLRSLMLRHENLRTRFMMSVLQPVLVIDEQVRVELPVIDLEGVDEQHIPYVVSQVLHEATSQPFDLYHGPLLRIALLRLKRESVLFSVVTHHILFDAWATSIFLRELLLLYQAFLEEKPSPLTPLPLQYADFASWQRQYLTGAVLNTLVDYWTVQLRGAQPLELPTDRPRTKGMSNRGATITFKLPAQIVQGLRALSRQGGVTLFMTLLTAFQILLYRYTEQQDLVVGTDIANRTLLETEDMVGFFVNLLVLRHRLDGQATFRETVKSVCAMVLDAYAHQDLPFEKLVDALQLAGKPGRVPLVNVLFVLQNVPLRTFTLPGIAVSEIDVETDTAKFDVALFLVEEGLEMSGSVNYRTDLFEAGRIERLIRHFEVLLQHIVAQPDVPVETLEMLREEEKEQQLQAERAYAETQRLKIRTTRRRVVTSTSES